MAQVVQDDKLRARIEHYLDYLIREWEDVPHLAAEWLEWDEHDQLDFVIEWPIREDRLHQLQHWTEQGLLTPEQYARYEDLLTLVEQHRPMLDRLLAD